MVDIHFQPIQVYSGSILRE